MGYFFSTPEEKQRKRQERLNYRLFKACFHGYPTAVIKSLAQGADPNTPYENRLPLHIAIERRNFHAVKLLIDAKAGRNDTEALDQIIAICHWYNSKETIESLLQNIDDDHLKAGPFLRHEGLYRHEELVKILIDRGCNTDVKNADGITPLHYAAGWNCLSVVPTLIERGIDINTKGDNNGWTPLHYACLEGHFFMAELLVKNGADINARDLQGRKPIDVATEHKHGNVIRFLVEKENELPAAPAPTSSQPGWHLTAPEEITLVSEKPSVGYRLTEIFNFKARMYIQIARNIQNQAESQTVKFFDEFPDKQLLEEAHQALVQKGGKAAASAVYGPVLAKKQP